ncbi:hypothetical protein MUK42_14064 [Musa troglodytarum]|uniref:Uncharacterized protein n=1 Tax=Musa troglodytarum TaxID=320322 RepID=A0A9E7GSD4_9LILI|nr:hypothetical protein MUK42_14064 [Musa troglodytarum]
MMTSARAASRIGGHRNLLFVPSPTTTTTTHHDQCHGEEQCQENTYKLFSSWKKKTTTMRKQTEEMSPSSNCKRLSTLLFRIHSAPYYCFPLGFAHKDWETKWNWNCVTMKGVLRNMRSQLYSAAEYFELSNMNDDGKEMVMRSLKDYAVKAIANAVDHLGSVSYKVDNLLDYEVDEASVATFEVSCIDQFLRGFLMPMLCLTSPAVGAVQFPLVLDGSAFGYLHLHLHQDAVPCHPREEDWV